MDENKNDGGFRYTYSATEKDEIKQIREKYTSHPKEESKLERLRRLDAGVNNVAQATSLVFGIIGTLILGFGMSLIMSDLAVVMGMSSDVAFPLGLALGAVGGVILGFAYPVYLFLMKRGRERIADEVIRLSDELLK